MGTRRRSRGRKPPRLTPEMISDHMALIDAIDQVLWSDRELRRRTGEVLHRQERLRAVAGQRAWKAFLRVNEVSLSRSVAELLAVATWAFEAGINCGRADRPR